MSKTEIYENKNNSFIYTNPPNMELINEVKQLINDYTLSTENMKKLMKSSSKMNNEQLSQLKNTLSTIGDELKLKYISLITPNKKYSNSSDEGILIRTQRKHRDAKAKYEDKIKYLIRNNNTEFVSKEEAYKFKNYYSKWFINNNDLYNHIKEKIVNNEDIGFKTNSIQGKDLKIGDFVLSYGDRFKTVLKVVKLTKSFIIFDEIKGERIAEDDGFKNQNFENSLYCHNLNSTSLETKKISIKFNFNKINIVNSFVLTERVFDYGY